VHVQGLWGQWAGRHAGMPPAAHPRHGVLLGPAGLAQVNPKNDSNTQYYGKWCEKTFGNAYVS